MEQQFILRLPPALQGVTPEDCRLVRTGQKQINFIVGDKTYPGIICRLPTILESQKTVDNKLYKVADISTLVVVYENAELNVEEELLKHESSGLTPPMANAKPARFTNTAMRTEEIGRVESQVAELLRADARALKVTIANEKESTEAEIDMLAAEIENELGVAEQVEVEEVAEEPVEAAEDPRMAELEQKIREKEEQIEKAVNPILKKRFEQALEALKAEYERQKK